MVVGLSVGVAFSPPRRPITPPTPQPPANAVTHGGQPLTTASGDVITHGA